MGELPSGTVTLLFSDIEGSTALLSRLGPGYAEALSGQRQVLRRAWAAHAGTEMGTEGDSFFVVFTTAPDAVAAAVQAQRELQEFDWPGGERVRVRMGVHTGNPTVHDGGYVGMDVHRAARIAGSAHGGQVVVSGATAALVLEELPKHVSLRDLGSHQFKDIAHPERVFQVVVDGVPAEFPPLRTMGSASSLPVPATPLVGRDGEVAELIALLESPTVRLVTLTGPGGSGKTRLAIGVAERLTGRFEDGLYFVDLAAATSVDVMWTTIAEALDVPAEGRIPPGFFAHVAHRSALLVLDNLEQVDGADAVMVELLQEAPQVVVVATSRRPLRIQAEHEHPVPPLELPDDDGADVAGSGAVQLFVQQASRVRPGFRLNPGNAADVVAICRGLDGLPLAIELAAARSSLLSPHALLVRLDTALDLKASGAGRPTRQRTLRDTIAWSYQLLTGDQQAFFRRLGVFAGGADLDAIGALCADILSTDDPLEVIGELVDANLVTVNEDANGEPRTGMLVTIRAYAIEQLDGDGELGTVRRRHAEYYCGVADELSAQWFGPQQPVAMRRCETEHDNFREALGLAFQTTGDESPSQDQVELGRRLCKALGFFWNQSGYYAEARRWLERSVGLPTEEADLLLSSNLTWLAYAVLLQGDYDRGWELANVSVDTARPFGVTAELVEALMGLGWCRHAKADDIGARDAFYEAYEIGSQLGDPPLTAGTLLDLAVFESDLGNHARSLQLNTEALSMFEDIQDASRALLVEMNMIWDLVVLGDLATAHGRSRALIHRILESQHPGMRRLFATNHAECLLGVGEFEAAARLIGAADAMRERLGVKDTPTNESHGQEFLLKCKEALSPEQFQRAYEAGRANTVEDLLLEFKNL